jgi:L-aminopeptidase/D-esterase-like protein
MHPYIRYLKTASLDELERAATAAVRKAVRQAHAAGRSTVGSDKDGQLVMTHPDGTETPFSPNKPKS